MIRPNSTPASGPLTRYAWQRIRRKAAWLGARPGFTRFDREDIEQELAVRLWQGLKNFNPAKGNVEAFITTVLRHAGNSLLRSRCSRRRGAHRVHQPLDEQGRVDHDYPVGEDPSLLPSSSAGLNEEAFELAHDVAVVLNRLSPELRNLADLLQRRSVTESAQHMGLSRSTVYARIRELRAHFTEAGLEKIT